MTCSTTMPSNSTWPRIAARSWHSSAARSAATNCTWDASRCSWLPTRCPTCPWPLPWSPPTTRATCGGSWGNLKTWGLDPEVVVTDGSNLYPTVLAELWPDADHQLCVFHIITDINKLTLDAVRRMRTAMSRRGKAGRKKKRGRKGAKSKAAARRGMTVKEKAHFVFQRRHLIVKRRENLTEAERDDLTRMLEYLPELATLRRFADRIYWLFDASQDLHQAGCRRAAIVRDPAFRAVPELVKAMEQIDAEKFPKLMVYLNHPVSRRVRTNNHVERTNRMFRFLEKVRYQWRRRRTLVRFVVLTLDGIWRERTIAQAKVTDRSKPTGPAKTASEKRKRRQAA